MFLSELKLYHTCFTYHLFKFRNKYIKIFSNNMWRISTEIKQTKTSSCCFSFLKNVLCMDRKQQCLFSVCLMNVSQERKQQCLLKPQFILKKINVGLLASKKNHAVMPTKYMWMFPTSFNLFAQINFKKFCKDSSK